ncbi:MAG: HAD family phosphatase [Prevotella sp.]|nr:HAD family phosphatase [Prevotella sp.]
MIRTLFFDLGGVIYTSNRDEAVRRFEALGLTDADRRLKAYTQQGFFGQLEDGSVSDDEFLVELSRLCRREVSWNECQHCWLGYCEDLPQRNLDMLACLRSEGYRLVLTSNTNPFVMEWTESNRFDGSGGSIHDYLDDLYVSYQLGSLKPSPDYFRAILSAEDIQAGHVLFVDDSPANVAAAEALGIHTLLAENGKDWTGRLRERLEEYK